MNMQDTQPNNQKSLLGYLLLLTVFFIFLEISFFIQSSEIYLGDYKLVANHIGVPWRVIPGILFFVGVQLFLHVIFTLIIWGVACLVGRFLNCPWRTTENFGFILWFVGVAILLLANQHFYPNSKFAHVFGFLFNDSVTVVLLNFLTGIMSITLIIALWELIMLAPLVFVGIMGFTSLLVFVYTDTAVLVADASSSEKPNIILIGIDSLRPDFLGYNGYEKNTPNLDEFLNQSTVFAEAFTPLARTFPAWVSILTGEYPKHSGVRFNLPTLDQHDWSQTLPNVLRRAGYQTIFSTDETRFSNIDESYGFDKTLTPPIGFNDFLLGNLNDFPLSNLLVNSSVGKYLFPYSFGNRPVFATYNPDSFLAYIKPTLMQPRTKPLFLAIHFCLPHFPYFWGKDAADDKSIHNYQASVKRVDQQFQDFLKILTDANLLKHSVVIVLSDHGEAIELPGDRVTEADLFISGKNKILPKFYPASFDFETVNQSAGHGTDVLGLTQYHIVLAARTFGLQQNIHADKTGLVSLLDIKPTVLDFVKFIDLSPSLSQSDGVSLKPVILGHQDISSTPKHFFYESDFSPQAVRTVHPETRKVLFEGIEYFQVDPKTARISVKKSMESLILSSKQFADIYGDWVLALYPQSKTQMMPVLVNLKTGEWTDDLDTSFAKASPVQKMLKELKGFYGKDITGTEV